MTDSISEYQNCRLCPRNCGVNRNTGQTGYCRSDSGLYVGSVCIHTGEEPAICGDKGICNIFFTGCNMQCIFCQNHQISRRNQSTITKPYTIDEVVDEVILCLENGVMAVGFVTPTHFSPHVRYIVKELNQRNYFPVIVYNTNGYEKPEVIATLEELVDVYLPDFKYLSPDMAEKYSETYDYPDVIKKSIAEMYRQKGSSVIVDDNGQALSGLIIRHLVLPEGMEDSKNILQWISEYLSVSVTISLMSQYYPTRHVTSHPVLCTALSSREYDEVVKTLEDIGFHNGWIQEIESQVCYKPDFKMEHPFEQIGLSE